MQNTTNVIPVEEKLSLIEKWKVSGQSRKAFAQEHNLNYTLFRQWVYHYSKKEKSSLSLPKEVLSSKENFVSIQIENVHPNAKAVAAVMEITLSNGSQLCFYQNPPVEYLRELLK